MVVRSLYPIDLLQGANKETENYPVRLDADACEVGSTTTPGTSTILILLQTTSSQDTGPPFAVNTANHLICQQASHKAAPDLQAQSPTAGLKRADMIDLALETPLSRSGVLSKVV